VTERSGFACGTCGGSHEGLPTDHGWKLPDDVWEIPESERAEKAHYDADLCKFGDRYFIRCVLYVPFTQRDGAFGFGVWVEVAEDDFGRYLEIYSEDARKAPPARGRLANVIPSFEDAAGEALTIRFGTSSQRPTVLMDADSHTSLAREQRAGMDAARYHQVLHDVGTL